MAARPSCPSRSSLNTRKVALCASSRGGVEPGARAHTTASRFASPSHDRPASNHERDLRCCMLHTYIPHGTRQTISADDCPCLRAAHAVCDAMHSFIHHAMASLSPNAAGIAVVISLTSRHCVQRYGLNALLACTACHCAPSSCCMAVPLPLPLISISTEPFSSTTQPLPTLQLCYRRYVPASKLVGVLRIDCGRLSRRLHGRSSNSEKPVAPSRFSEWWPRLQHVWSRSCRQSVQLH